MRLVGAAGMMGLLAACASGPRPALPPVPEEAVSLRALAESRGLRIGVAVSADALRADTVYRRWLAQEFNLVSTENAFKFGPLRPSPEEYDFRDADTIVDFAQRHGMLVRGHTLVWKRQLPEWLTAETYSRDELISMLREHIHTVVARYRGRVYAWDVVNEALANEVPDGAALDEVLRPTLWLQGIGPEYLELAFRWAHEADPGALLFYNEAGAEAMGPKADAVYALVRRLLDRGVPLHGVGLQMHTSVRDPPDPAMVARNMRRLAKLGLEIHITEMDVALAGAPGTEPAKLEAQAAIYHDVLAACTALARCTAFVMWGMTDRYTWRYPDHPLILDTAYRPKPAVGALKRALGDR
jgi:endo-1,4-beta-xylanase